MRSTKGRNAQGRKISGIEAMPGEDKVSSEFSPFANFVKMSK